MKKNSRGGKRKGAGRKPAPEKVIVRSVSFYESHLLYLLSLNSNLSVAIRLLVERVKDLDRG